MTCFAARNEVCKHPDDTLTRYVDFGPLLNTGETVSSATATCSDTTVTVGTPAVLSSATTDRDEYGNAYTIAANEGVSIALSGGTAIESYEDAAELTVTATLSTTEDVVIVCLLRVES